MLFCWTDLYTLRGRKRETNKSEQTRRFSLSRKRRNPALLVLQATRSRVYVGSSTHLTTGKVYHAGAWKLPVKQGGSYEKDSFTIVYHSGHCHDFVYVLSGRRKPMGWEILFVVVFTVLAGGLTIGVVGLFLFGLPGKRGK